MTNFNENSFAYWYMYEKNYQYMTYIVRKNPYSRQDTIPTTLKCHLLQQTSACVSNQGYMFGTTTNKQKTSKQTHKPTTTIIAPWRHLVQKHAPVSHKQTQQQHHEYIPGLLLLLKNNPADAFCDCDDDVTLLLLLLLRNSLEKISKSVGIIWNSRRKPGVVVIVVGGDVGTGDIGDDATLLALSSESVMWQLLPVVDVDETLRLRIFLLFHLRLSLLRIFLFFVSVLFVPLYLNIRVSTLNLYPIRCCFYGVVLLLYYLIFSTKHRPSQFQSALCETRPLCGARSDDIRS